MMALGTLIIWKTVFQNYISLTLTLYEVLYTFGPICDLRLLFPSYHLVVFDIKDSCSFSALLGCIYLLFIIL